MKTFRSLSLLALAALVSACAGTEPASRAAVNPQTTLQTMGGDSAALPAAAVSQAPYQIAGVSILVPESLRVSEANVFYPIADIVWRGEPRGERHQQVKNIYAEAISRATAGMTSGRAVLVEVEVTRFHCLTEKTRYTVGGTHALHFTLTLRDAATGAVIEGPRAIIADVKAAGGSIAVAEEAQGLTQRVVVVNRLAEVLQYELTHHQPLAPAGEMISAVAGVAPLPAL
jgi:hypothetical protein